MTEQESGKKAMLALAYLQLAADNIEDIQGDQLFNRFFTMNLKNNCNKFQESLDKLMNSLFEGADIRIADESVESYKALSRVIEEQITPYLEFKGEPNY
jgi:hypothetical protein